MTGVMTGLTSSMVTSSMVTSGWLWMVITCYYPKVAVGFPAFDPGNINKPCTSSNQGIRSDLRGGGDRKGPSMNKSWFVNSLN